MSLRPTYEAVRAGTIANILLDAIPCAGLGGQGFSANCFCPTLANAAIDSACKPVNLRLLCKSVAGKLRRFYLIIMCTPGHLPMTQTMCLSIRV